MTNYFRKRRAGALNCILIVLGILCLAIIIPGSSRGDRPLPSDIRKDHGYQPVDQQSLKEGVPDAQYWKKFGEQLKATAPSDELQRARYVASQVANELDRRGITPNTSLLTRIDASVRYGNREAATCGYLNDAVTESLKGAGFDGGQIHSLVGYKDGWQALNKGYFLDVNINHVAPVVVIDGVPYSFDLWAHSGSEGNFKNFDNSAWNGIKTKDWGKLMNKHAGYNSFSSDEGVTKKELDEADQDLIEKTKANLKAIKIEVKDNFGKPVSGAHVTLTGEVRLSGTTGVDGTVTARGVKPAKYAVRVTAEGYLAYTAETQLAPARDDHYAISLEPVLSIVAARVKSGSLPVADVTVRMSSRSPEATGDSGEAQFDKVPPGTYTLTAEASGFGTESKKVTVKPKDEKAASVPVVVDFNLKPKVNVKITGPGQAFTGDIIELETEIDAADSIRPSLKYAWRLAGDNTVLASTARFKRTLVQPGTYYVSLVVYVVRPDTHQTVLVGEALHKVIAEQRRISVELSGPGESKVGEEVTLRARIKQLKGSDKEPSYSFVWSVNGAKFGGNSENQPLKVTRAGQNVVQVIVWQAIGGKWVRAGDARHTFTAAGPDPAKGSISVSGPSSTEVGGNVQLTASISDTNVPSSALYYSWIVNGRRYNYKDSVSLPASAPGTYYVVAELWMRYQPKPVKLAQASHNVTVYKKGGEPDPFRDLMEALGGGNKPATTTTGQPARQQPPAPAPTGRAYTSRPLPTSQPTISGTWNAVDSKGRFNGKMTLSQSGSGVSGTMQTSGGSIPVSGSISGNTVSVILTFGNASVINQYMQDMRVSQAIGSITAKATFTIGSNANEIQGTLYPFHVQWNDDGKTVVIKRKWQGGETHPGNPPRPFTLRK